MEFLGYERPDGSVGVRNYVAVISGGRCANELAAKITNEVKGTVALLPDYVCVRLGEDNKRALRTLIGLGCNPNVASCVVVGIGCEHVDMVALGDGIAKSKKPVEVLTVLGSNYETVLDRGIIAARNMVSQTCQMQRKPFDLGHLTLGVKCGASNATSGIVGNPATGQVFDKLIAEGGSAIFSETTELIGATHLLAKRAVSKEVARRLHEAVDRMVDVLKDTGVVSALISAGGSSIYALGTPPGRQGWKVKIRHPRSPGKTVEEIVLRDRSMSTSGSYEKFFMAGGKLYSHIFDPRTGYPATGMLSVSVVAPRTLDSEAWTKPFFVRGRRWAARHKPEGFRVYICEDRMEVACAWLQ